MSSQYVNLPGYGNYQWKAPVPTAADLPTVNNLVGDARVDEQTSVIYVWNGSAWVANAGTAGVSSLNSLTGAVTLAAGTNVTLGTVGNTITINSTGGGGGGSVTSVALAEGSSTPIYSISGSPVTSTGTLTFTLQTQSAHAVFAGPTSGSAAQPTFRALVAGDIPALSYVTSVALADSTGLFNISGSPVTSSGTLTLASFQSQAQHAFFAAPSGAAGAPTFRAIVASDVPTLNQNTTGTAANITASSNSTLTTLSALSLPTSQLSGQVSLGQLPSIANNTVLGNVSGITAVPSALTQTQLTALINSFTSSLSGAAPASGGGTTNFLRADGSWAAPSAGSGTVTSVAFSDASTTPIYSISGSPVTTSGTLTQTLSTQIANTVFAGPASGSAAQPAFRTLVSLDIPNNAANTTGTAANITASTNSSLTTLSVLSLPFSQITGTVPIAQGGTNITSYTTGDVLYASATNVLSKLGIGLSGQVLAVVSGVPAWATNSPSFSGLTTQGVIYATSSSAVASTAAGAIGTVLVGGGSSSAPSFSATILLGTPASVNGSIGIANGAGGGHTATINSLATSTYNFNLPVDAGTAGLPLVSQGGGSTAMTWSQLSLTAAVSGILPIANGGTNSSSVISAPTATSWAGWDANLNLSANNLIDGYATTATAGATTTLTVSSAGIQYFTGSTTQTVKLPVSGTLALGQSFTIVNLSTGVVTVETSGLNTIQAMASNTQLVITYTTVSGGSGTAAWNWEYTLVNNSLPTTGTVTSIALAVPAFLNVSGSPVTTSGTITVGLSGTALPIANGGTAKTSVTTAPTATSWAGWDANSNLSANNHIAGYRTTATAGTTTTLVVGDAEQQYFTGSTTQTVVLPVTSTLVLGQSYTIVNNSSGVVTVESSGTNSIQAMAANTQLVVTVISTSLTTAAAWNATYSPLAGGSGSVSSVAMSVPAFLSVSGSPITTSGTLAVTLSGTALPIANGGTGQTTAAAAFSALSPITTTGDLIYSSSGTTNSRLAIGSTNQVLTVVSGAPAWAAAPAASLSYASGYTNGDSPGRTWSTTSSSFATPTISGGSASYTSRVSSGITITQAASNAPGIVFTPSSSTAVYIITCNTSTVLTSGLSGLFAAQLYNSTTSTVLATSPTLQEAANTNMPVFITGIVAPASTSAQTIVLQALTSNASAAAIVGFTQAGGSDVNFEWTVMQIHA